MEPFFCQNVLGALPTYAFQHGPCSEFAFVGLASGPHKRFTNCGLSSSLARFHEIAVNLLPDCLSTVIRFGG